jgi:hypothetical protein
MVTGGPAWHREILPEPWEEVMADLASRSVLDGFYLGGGTGLALHFGHRRSVHFDLFREQEFDPADLQRQLVGLSAIRIRQVRRGTLHVVVHGISVSFLHFPYRLLFPLARLDALTVADPRDIACTKVHAVAGRGSRRDFVDLYVAARRFGLANILKWSEERFSATPYDRVHLYKALTFFRDAEGEPMPDMLVPLEWSEVTSFFTQEVPRLAGL